MYEVFNSFPDDCIFHISAGLTSLTVTPPKLMPEKSKLCLYDTLLQLSYGIAQGKSCSQASKYEALELKRVCPDFSEPYSILSGNTLILVKSPNLGSGPLFLGLIPRDYHV